MVVLVEMRVLVDDVCGEDEDLLRAECSSRLGKTFETFAGRTLLAHVLAVLTFSEVLLDVLME